MASVELSSDDTLTVSHLGPATRSLPPSPPSPRHKYLLYHKSTLGAFRQELQCRETDPGSKKFIVSSVLSIKMISVEAINTRHNDILLGVFLSLLLPQKLSDIKYFLTGFTMTFYNVVVVKNSREEIVDIKTNTGNDWIFEQGTSLELICQGNGSYFKIIALSKCVNRFLWKSYIFF